jgi:hypothetical protein
MRATRAKGCTLLLLASGCAATVTVTPAGPLTAPPRAEGCQVEFFRSKVPDRPYDELAGLHAEGGMSAGAVQEKMRAKACEVGADAVLVTRDYVPGTKYVPALMTGTAVKYRAAPAAQPKATAP